MWTSIIGCILLLDVSLNESIEILRGDNKTAKATRKGRTQKKTKKDEQSDCEQQAGETTEVLRSSKLLKRSQMKTERIVKAEPVPKTDSNISKCGKKNDFYFSYMYLFYWLKYYVLQDIRYKILLDVKKCHSIISINYYNT
jgi:hypothetical protein